MIKIFPENCQNILEEKLGIVTGFYILYLIQADKTRVYWEGVSYYGCPDKEKLLF